LVIFHLSVPIYRSTTSLALQLVQYSIRLVMSDMRLSCRDATNQAPYKQQLLLISSGSVGCVTTAKAYRTLTAILPPRFGLD